MIGQISELKKSRESTIISKTGETIKGIELVVDVDKAS